jgi:NADP-dependent 3-hydroxy acid dehydrogenase YdfG
MTKQFEGRAALITGASSGIGRSIAQRLGSAGMETWLVGRSESGLAQTAQAIAAAGGAPTHSVALDVAKPGALSGAIAGVDHPHLFAVINCAGVMYPEPIIDADPRRWREMFDVNVLAVLEGSQAAVRRMRAQNKSGHVINFSSLTARWDAGTVYGASKAAVEMIGRSLRKELERDDIRVTTVVPGGFATQLSRGLSSDMAAVLGENARKLGVPPPRMLGDAGHIGELVAYILSQPIELNIGEVVIRPAVSLEF